MIQTQNLNFLYTFEFEFNRLKEKLENEEKNRTKCEKAIIKQQRTIDNLKKELLKERIRSSIYEYELKKHSIITSFNLDILDNDIKITSKETKEITLHLYNSLDLENPEVKTILNEKKYKRQNKNITTENPEEQEERVKKIEEEREKILISNNLDVPVKEINDEIKIIFDNIETKTIFNKDLEKIKKLRFKLLGKFDLKQYKDFLSINIEKIENLISKKKNFSEFKLKKETCKFFYPLEKRLIFYGDYYDTHLENEDINRFKLLLDIKQDNPKRYLPFNYEEFYNKINNYGLAILPISIIIQKTIINPFGFNSIIYINNKESKESKENDNFSFYILTKVEDSIRYWNMDCRLYNFSSKLRELLKDYCIKIFRRIYFDVFSDNKYIIEYDKKSIILSEDCEQLLQNISFCCNEKEFCNFIIDLISKNCIHNKTKNDKFNIKADDRNIKNKFKEMKDKKNLEELKETFSIIFDNISEENKELLLEKYK